MIKILDVCSGIGGFSLGLEATGGFDTVAFCEYDEFCRKVLNKHWPDVPIYKDLKEIGNEPTRLIQEFDLICGGVPCQPFSVAGKKKGKEDDRHLWPYMFKIIKHKKPTWVIVENVGGFVNVALDDVCLDLETEGYATQSFIIPACGVEAPHRRDRVWILGKFMGDTSSDGRSESKPSEEEGRVIGQSEEGRVLESEGTSDGGASNVDDSECNEHIEEIRKGDGEEREDEKRQGEEDSASRISSGTSGLRVSDQGHETNGHVADTESDREDGVSRESESEHGQGDTRLESSSSNNGRIERGSKQDVADSESSDRDDDEVIKEHGETKTQEVFGNRSSVSRTQERYTQHREGNAKPRLGGMVDGVSSRLDGHHGFEVEPDIPRVAENIPDRVNRLKALGNSIVPQIIYHIGMAILEEERKENESV
jgi:DNA (cytosine-5)-methyltransferase 1